MDSSEYIKFYNNPYKNELQTALNIVKQFIIDNELIIVGGMAIDLALQTKGKYLYDEYEIPDYDVYSDKFLQHAEELTNIFCKKKYQNTSMISAIHNTTIRIKVYNYTVFDITYVPHNIFKILPTFQYLNLKVISPQYQKIDQYNSLSFLFEKTGVGFNIEHRFLKDLERNQLLVNNFPLKNNISKIIQNKKTNILNDIFILTNNIDSKENYFDANGIFCIHGVQAYHLYYLTMEKIVKKINNKVSNQLFSECIKDISDEFEDTYISSNNEIDTVKKMFQNKYDNLLETYYNKTLDIYPGILNLKNKNKNINILDNFGRLLSVNKLYYDNKEIIVSNIYYLQSYFLIMYYIHNKKESLLYYNSLLKFILINQYLLKNFNTEYLKILDELKLNPNIFHISLNTFGTKNYPSYYYYFVNNYNHVSKYKSKINLKPKNNYPIFPNCKLSNQRFSTDNSILFQIDGKESKNKKINFSFLLNENY